VEFLVDILPLGSGSVDPHIFADPDPGSQNLADPTDPDPKHCEKHKKWYNFPLIYFPQKIICYSKYLKPYRKLKEVIQVNTASRRFL
jgi:hypothetical protein